jgi:3-methyl-2-oxobutanoate hydroxymethyltransferase
VAERITVKHLREMKARGEKIAMLTAYDFVTARAVDGAGAEIILVGDSLANTVLGYENTIAVTMEEMLHHVKPVARAAKRSMVVGDMPFMSYQVSKEQALENAGRFLKEGGARAVKIEGGERMVSTVSFLVEAGVPVMGHLGLTPQSLYQLGGYRVQGRESDARARMLEDALLLEEAGAFSLVLECVPLGLAAEITSRLAIPTIGIGAGPKCDGQVLVIHDLLGLSDKESLPKFVKPYAQLGKEMRQALATYVKEVREGMFPDDEHSYH